MGRLELGLVMVGFCVLSELASGSPKMLPVPSAYLRLRGGVYPMLPLWSFPTYPNEDGGEEREDDRVQLLSTSPAHDNMAKWSSELAARGIDKELQVNQLQEGQQVAGKSETTRVEGVTRKERHIHVEAARVHWWNGHIEAAEREFLSALAWYRAPTNFTAQTPPNAAGGNDCNKDMQGDDWPDTATNYVSADGSLRSHANKCGRTCGGDSVEERDAMCAYAAFLFEDTPHKLIAEELLRQVLRFEPTHQAAIDLLGLLLESEGRVSEARAVYSELPAYRLWERERCLCPWERELYLGLYVKKGREGRAQWGGEDDEWVADVAPSKEQALPLARLAKLYNDLTRRDAALQLLELALACDTSCVDALLLKAELLELSDSPRLAKEALEAALRAQPPAHLQVEALLALANLHAEQCEALGGEEPPDCTPPRQEWSLEQAEVLYQRACEVRLLLHSAVRTPDLLQLIRLRKSGARNGFHWRAVAEYASFAYRHLNQTATVEALCDRALQTAGESAEALIRIAWLKHVALGQVKEARALMRQALKLQPSNARAHRVYGNLLLRDGRLASAEKSLVRSVWLDASDAAALLDLGHLLASQKRLSQARVRFQQAYEASSNREDAAAADVCMAALYLAVDRPNDAHAFFQRAQSRDATVANEETLLQLVSDFRATPTAAPAPPSATPSAPHQDQAHEFCKSSADGDGTSQAHADHVILPNTSNLSCPVNAHKQHQVPLPLPAASGAAGISRHEPLCARQVSSCAQQGGKGCGQESGARLADKRVARESGTRLASHSDTLYTNTVLAASGSHTLGSAWHDSSSDD